MVKGAEFSPDEVLAILEETSQVIEYSRELERKSRALEVATDELKRANQRLTELDRLKDEFITTVSHELRTPLTSIRSFSEILPTARPRARRAQPVPGDRGQGIRTSDPPDQRHPRSVADPNRQHGVAPFDLRPEGHPRRRARRDEWPVQGQGDHVAARFESDLPRITVDRDRLMQVVINLLSNAAKFAQAEGGRAIGVRMARDSAGWRWSASRTTAPGFRTEQTEAVFDRSHQLRGDDVTGKPRGWGLGLAICRQIVEHFGGRIWVEPAKPTGAVFRFTARRARPRGRGLTGKDQWKSRCST